MKVSSDRKLFPSLLYHLDMCLGRLQSHAHCIYANMRRPQIAPAFEVLPPGVGVFAAQGEARFDADGVGVAACFSSVLAQLFNFLSALVVGPPLRHPAV